MTDELQKIFLEIRDIPYRLRHSADEEDFSCDGKHKKLADRLTASGYKVRWRVCSYRWRDLPIPQEILNLNPYEFSYHFFLEVYTENGWAVLDATWDRGLEEILSVNNLYDKSDMKIAVPYLEIFSPEESLRIIRLPHDKDKINESLRNLEGFYSALNDWLDEARNKNM